MKRLLIFLVACLTIVSCTGRTSLIWSAGPVNPEDGKCTYTMTIQNPPAGTDWHMWFCQFRVPIQVLEGSQADINHVSGTLYLITPTTDTKGEDLVITYTGNPLVNQCRAPEAFYLVRKGNKAQAIETQYIFQPEEEIHSFEYTHVASNVTDMVPQLKNVILMDGKTDIDLGFTATIIDGKQPGWYRIVLDGNTSVEAADADGAYWAKITLENIIRNAGSTTVDNMEIEDWPDLAHRGVMLDVSRNFTKKETVLQLIDMLAHYKANVFHLHFGDDEGWRVEIDALPELTSYGAFRSLPVLNEDGTISEPDALQPSYSGSLDRNDASAPGNGYYTHEDFVEILRYATERHIRVIPEFDTPGHSRAAIKSMEKRFETTGDASCRLYEPGDVSEYESVQDYTDNAINVALPSTYKFIETVFDAIIAMYNEAGAPLEAIHVGGDEVPEGVWEKSPACKEIMAENGWTDPNLLKGYFVKLVLEIAKAKGVKIAGWQELALHLDDEAFDNLTEQMAYANVWNVSWGNESMPYEYANCGLNVVISGAPSAYLDLAYNDSKLERGHSWGGFVDERRTFSLQPFNIYRSIRWDNHRRIVDIENADKDQTPLNPDAKSRIIGIQGQLWSETIRSADHVTYYIFPKTLGLFERGWNATPDWGDTTVSDDPRFMYAFDKFYSIIVDHEFPYFDSLGISYHKN